MMTCAGWHCPSQVECQNRLRILIPAALTFAGFAAMSSPPPEIKPIRRLRFAGTRVGETAICNRGGIVLVPGANHDSRVDRSW